MLLFQCAISDRLLSIPETNRSQFWTRPATVVPFDSRSTILMELLRKILYANRLAKWDIKSFDAWLFVCFVFLGSFLLSSLFVSAYSFLSGAEQDFESLPLVLASGFGLQLSSILAWYLFKQFAIYEVRDQPVGWLAAAKVGAIGFACVYLALMPTMLIWRLFLDTIGIEYEFQLPVLLVQNGGSPVEMALMICLIVIVAPICEELVYRGFLFRYLNHRLPRGLSILVPSLIFALMHFNLHSFMPLLVLSIALCIVYRASGNLVSSVTVHALFNLVNVLMIYLIEPIEL